MRKRVFMLCVSFCLLSNLFAITPVRLTCQMSQNPFGVDNESIRFGWELISDTKGDRQTAYEIVLTTKELGQVVVCWNSGKVDTDQNQLVRYGGSPLKLATRYQWRVKVWDANSKESEWSEEAHFETKPDWERYPAQWIGAVTRAASHLPEGRVYHNPSLSNLALARKHIAINPLAHRSILLRKSLHVKSEISKASVYVCGLGHYRLTINGQKVGESVFAPLWSDYDKTIYFNSFPVDHLVKQGDNVLGVTLGNGFYNSVGDRYSKLWVSFGPPTLLLVMNITYANGQQETICSNDSWKYDLSPIVFNDIYGGEDYDANLEQKGWDTPPFNDALWSKVVVQDPPKGRLQPQLAAPVKEMEHFGIKSKKELESGVYVLNMGQNLSGYPRIKVKGRRGQTIKLIPAEEESINQDRTGGPHYYQYTLKGDGVEEWAPQFSYYGYQYLRVENVDMDPAEEGKRPRLLDVESNFIHNSFDRVGSFECSNELFNQVHWLINNAIKSNAQAVFTDCPHREKLGWLEEVHLNGPGLYYNYDLRLILPKVMQDMSDAQLANGLVPSIATEYVRFEGGFVDSPEWGSAIVICPWMYYEYYGDNSLIKQYYPQMKRYVDYLSTTANERGIVSHGLGDWYDYGDHPAGSSRNTPIALSATAHYYYAIDLLVKSAEMIGNGGDVATYKALRTKVKDAFNTQFFNPKTKQYGTGSQCSNAMPIFMGIVPPKDKEAVMKNLIADIEQKGNRLSTGDVGNRYLFQALARNGQNELMYKMHNHYDTPGYGFQIKFGLTTLTEQWDPRKGSSWNHFMMGQIEEWFYASLAGIRSDGSRPGFKHFFIDPQVVGDLTYVKAAYRSQYGEIKVDWKRDNEKFTMTVTVPVNTTATVILPDKKHTKKIVGSGSHTFAATMSQDL